MLRRTRNSQTRISRSLSPGYGSRRVSILTDRLCLRRRPVELGHVGLTIRVRIPLMPLRRRFIGPPAWMLEMESVRGSGVMLRCRRLKRRQRGDEDRRDKFLHRGFSLDLARCMTADRTPDADSPVKPGFDRKSTRQTRPYSARPSRGPRTVLRTHLPAKRHRSHRCARMAALPIVGRRRNNGPESSVTTPPCRRAWGPSQTTAKSLMLRVEATPGIEPG